MKNRLSVNGRLADGLIAGTLLAAVAVGGGCSAYLLPVLAVFALAAWGVAIATQHESGKPVYMGPVVVVLAALGLLTVLQAVPLPPLALKVLSPKAYSLREGVDAIPTLSYEPGATMREAARYFIYAVLAAAAGTRVRAQRKMNHVCTAVVFAGLSSAAIALVNRALHVHDLFGLNPADAASADMLTTFHNQNCAAGFLNLAALTAVGLAMSGRVRSWRFGFIAAAVVCTGMSVVQLSRGGLIGLVLGFSMAAWLLARRRKVSEQAAWRPKPITAIGAVGLLALPSGVLLWYLDRVVGAFRETGQIDVSPQGKLAAFRDALPMLKDHLLFGIGRGSYESIYRHYKTSPVQLVFAYPENFLVQYTCDWGLILGLAVSIALVAYVAYTAHMARSAVTIGAVSGVAAVVIQNLVDFSLEIPAVAMAVVMLLASFRAEKSRALQIKPDRLGRRIGLIAAPALGIALAACCCFLYGDVQLDTKHIASVAPGGGMLSLNDYRTMARRHPANDYFAERASYAAEFENSKDLTEAMHWANRVILLDPTYADGHYSVGRILIKTGHRAQGFGEMRNAWPLFVGQRKVDFIYDVVSAARRPEEILRAVPRRDPELDVVDENELAYAINAALRRKRVDWAKALLAAASDQGEGLTAAGLYALGEAARAVGDHPLSLSYAQRAVELDRRYKPALMLLVQELRVAGRGADARQEIEKALASGQDDPVGLLRELLATALAEGNVDAARGALQRLRDALRPTYHAEVELARDEVDIEMLAGNRERALEALDRGIRLAPQDLGMRKQRAQILRRAGLGDAARADLNYVLERRPTDSEAQNILHEMGMSFTP